MNVLYWNARGFANEDTQRALRNLVHVHKPIIVCIAEPFVLIYAIPASFWRSLNLVPFATNDRGSQDPNLWLLCHVDIRPSLLASSAQQVSIYCSIDGVSCYLTAVYAKTTIAGRRLLWQDLVSIQASHVHGPWLVLGDFNCVLGAHEKRGGNLPNATSCYEFQQMCSSCNLLNIDTIGAAFTWTNRRTEVRLDRALGNLEWFDAWANFECRTLTKAFSDHYPIMVSCSRILPNHGSPFRFHSMWLQHPDFKALVQDFWVSLRFYGCPMFILASKLKALKVKLKAWNKSHFGDINTQVKSCKATLDLIQTEISLHGPSDVRFQGEDVAHENYQLALSMQASLLRTKSRIRWLVDGDRNTSFLHNMVKIRRLRKSLAALKVGPIILRDQVLISNHIVNYFHAQFTKDSSIVNTGLVERIIPCLVTADENAMLTVMPSADVITATVKSMDGFSAPGPDGFGGCFFQNCWEIISHDIIAAVQSFF